MTPIGALCVVRLDGQHLSTRGPSPSQLKWGILVICHPSHPTRLPPFLLQQNKKKLCSWRKKILMTKCDILAIGRKYLEGGKYNHSVL